MLFRGWRRKAKPRRLRRRASTVTIHYKAHKEQARTFVHERLEYWNTFYGHTYNRVAVRNQRTCWGSCSSNNNLNFNYKILFLPLELADYVIVHELCHLKHLNHSSDFWEHVSLAIPDYRERKRALSTVSAGKHLQMQER